MDDTLLKLQNEERVAKARVTAHTANKVIAANAAGVIRTNMPDKTTIGKIDKAIARPLYMINMGLAIVSKLAAERTIYRGGKR